MADLTLERIAELRAMHEKVRSSGWADAIKAMAEWSLQLRMSSDVLLDAAERGLTGGWVRNGPGVEKPKGDCIVRTRDGNYAVMQFREDWWKCPYLVANVRMCFPGSDVTHFMELKEPTDA